MNACQKGQRRQKVKQNTNLEGLVLHYNRRKLENQELEIPSLLSEVVIFYR